MEYSETFKKNAVRAVANGKTATEVCKGIGILSSTLRKWEVELGVTLPEGLSDSQIIWNLKNRLYEKQIELEIINNCSCFNNLSLSSKCVDLDNLVPKYGVHAVCKVLNVPRGTYYNHALRSPEKTQLDICDEKLKPIIKSIFEETKGMIGSSKIRVIMMNKGYVIDLKHLRRLMNEMNLVCTTRQKVAHNTEPPKQKYYRNRLKQRFEVESPNKVWVSDTTYLYLNGEPYFLRL